MTDTNKEKETFENVIPFKELTDKEKVIGLEEQINGLNYCIDEKDKQIAELQAENERIKRLNDDFYILYFLMIEDIANKNDAIISEGLGQLNNMILNKRK